MRPPPKCNYLEMAVCRLFLSIKFNREVTPQKNCRQRRQTSNVRLPLELRSDRRETSATRVSDDLQLSICGRFHPKNCFVSVLEIDFSQFSAYFGGAWQVLKSKSVSLRFFLQMMKFSRLYEVWSSFLDFSPSVFRRMEHVWLEHPRSEYARSIATTLRTVFAVI